MHSLKNTYLIILLSLLIYIPSVGQLTASISTDELIKIAKVHGLDSALRWAPHYAIFTIDTATALELIQMVHQYDVYSSSTGYFDAITHSCVFPETQIQTILIYRNWIDLSMHAIPDKYGNIHGLPYGLANSLLKQFNDTIENLIVDNIEYWMSFSKDLEPDLPPRWTWRFPVWNINRSQKLRSYHIANRNAALSMWILGKANSENFSKTKYEFDCGWRSWESDFEESVNRYNDSFNLFSYHSGDTILLESEYSELSEIDFENEPELYKRFRVVETENTKVVNQLLHSKLKGFIRTEMDMMSDGYVFDSSGEILYIELIDKDHLRILPLEGWL